MRSELLGYLRQLGLVQLILTPFIIWSYSRYYQVEMARSPATGQLWRLAMATVILFVITWVADFLLFLLFSYLINRVPELGMREGMKLKLYFYGCRWEVMMDWLRDCNRLRGHQMKNLVQFEQWAAESPAVELTDEMRAAINAAEYGAAKKMIAHAKYLVGEPEKKSRRQVWREQQRLGELHVRAQKLGLNSAELDACISVAGYEGGLDWVCFKEKEAQEAELAAGAEVRRAQAEAMTKAAFEAEQAKCAKYFSALESRIAEVLDKDLRAQLSRELAVLRIMEWDSRPFRKAEYVLKKALSDCGLPL